MTTAQIQAIDYTLNRSAIDYVLKRSWVCRRWRSHSSWLVGEAVEFIQRENASRTYQDLRDGLASHLTQCVRRDLYGNPVLIWILLNVVVPIVIRLVINWWLKQKID